MQFKKNLFYSFILIAMASCNSQHEASKKPVQLITLDPGHFHAALVQKMMYDSVDPTVYVYAPEGSDLQQHLNRINDYNNRKDDPTHWNEQVYKGADFFDKMIAEKKGNVVVLAGNNREKSQYILRSLLKGFNVLADKPMAIDSGGFEDLKRAFAVAHNDHLMLYDIMTERYETTTILQQELSTMPGIFGSLEKGSPENPAVVKESIHYFYKYVSGNVLTRPAWFFDASQQGEGIVDVMTHLVDLVQQDVMFEKQIQYETDIQVNTAKRWSTPLQLHEFKTLTGMNNFPEYLQKNIVNDSILNVMSNGEINYTLKGVYARTKVTWNYKAPEGTGDAHYSILRGSAANLVIRQGAEEQFKPTLYIEPISPGAAYDSVLTEQFKQIQIEYPGASLKKSAKGWQVIVPEKYNEGHEAHFARVMKKFLEYMETKNMPGWEVQGMLAKYYTTTKGLAIALKNKE